MKWQRILYQPGTPMGADGQRITDCEAHRALSKNAAKEGMVLLKNEGGLLPFAQGTKLAVFGKAAIDYVKGGGGSGDVTVAYVKNLYDGLMSMPEQICVYDGLYQFYQKNVRDQYEAGAAPGMTAEPEIPQELLKKARAFTDTAVITICRFSGEGWDRKSSYDEGMETEDAMLKASQKLFEHGDFYLSDAEQAMVAAVKASFPKVAVVLNVGGVVDTAWFAEDAAISSVLMAWQGGMEGGQAAAELLCGKGCPSGKLADTFARRLEDYPSSYNFHESQDFVQYTDDIYVGYRYFETIPGAAEKVMYPFGYGLSYTTFEWSVCSAEETEGKYRVIAEVTNTGKTAGREVLQVYVSAPQGKLGKPAKVLAAYAKTRLLQPGDTQKVTISFSMDQAASYDDMGQVQKSAYVLEAGTYQLWIGTSVRQVKKLAVYELAQTKVVQQLSEKLKPTSLTKRLLSDGSYLDLEVTEPHDPNSGTLDPAAKAVYDGRTPAWRSLKGVTLWRPDDAPKKKLIEVAEGAVTLEEFVAQMSDADLAHLLGGQPNTGVANTFGFGNMPEYGIPNFMTADGPAGLRIQPECGVNTTAWPCATLLACTWDPEIVYAVGEAGAKEVKENNIAIWLTPAINIHRTPMCGRNFEYYSEDPYIAGTLAGAMVKGIQSQRIAATVKHFAFNNKETNRRESDSRLSERAAREIYLKAFEMIVKEAKPWCIMSSYNIVNGIRTSENHELLEDILRGEWGFDGLVTTDWWTMGEHYKEVKAGNDMKMATGIPENLLAAREQGLLSREEMELCAKRILQVLIKFD